MHGPKGTDGGSISMMDNPPLLDLRFADDILIFSETAEGGRIVARCFDYNTGQDRLKIKRFEDRHRDNRGTATRPHHDASWTHHCCKGQFWNTQMVGLHAFSTWPWEC